MQTALSEEFKHTREGHEADSILRSCVHCGFCTATCPTYQLLGDELDSPRGRIYLIKELLEGNDVTEKTQLHLDRCLTCRSCETTCPSGVRYGRLLEIGREIVERRVKRPLRERFKRQVLLGVIPHTGRFSALLNIGRILRAFLPPALGKKIPARQAAQTWPVTVHARKMLLLEGCVQSRVTPNTNSAAAQVLDKLGISAVPAAGCCGAVAHHLPQPEEALTTIRHNIDAWWPQVENGVEVIISTASGCGVMVKDYGHLLAHDPEYAEKAARISGMTRDISEVLSKEDLSTFITPDQPRIAFHSPCTLQHGQKLNGRVEGLLQSLGYQLTPVPDAHICCGSAGTYSLLQPELSQQLLKNKLNNLTSGQPEMIVTANVGCQIHLNSAGNIPVKHWIELFKQ